MTHFYRSPRTPIVGIIKIEIGSEEKRQRTSPPSRSGKRENALADARTCSLDIR